MNFTCCFFFLFIPSNSVLFDGLLFLAKINKKILYTFRPSHLFIQMCCDFVGSLVMLVEIFFSISIWGCICFKCNKSYFSNNCAYALNENRICLIYFLIKWIEWGRYIFILNFYITNCSISFEKVFIFGWIARVPSRLPVKISNGPIFIAFHQNTQSHSGL